MQIKSVRRLKLDKPIPVYDISVSKNDNFILENGVVVHNSKDMSDCVAGIVYVFSRLRSSFRGTGTGRPVTTVRPQGTVIPAPRKAGRSIHIGELI